MDSDKKIDRRIYMRSYYDEHRSKMIRQIIEKQSIRRNSDTFIEQHRDKLTDDLNNGKRKFLQRNTLAKYDITQDKKSLKYYHNTVNDSIQDEFTQIDEDLLAEPTINEITLMETYTETIVDDIK